LGLDPSPPPLSSAQQGEFLSENRLKFTKISSKDNLNSKFGKKQIIEIFWLVWAAAQVSSDKNSEKSALQSFYVVNFVGNLLFKSVSFGISAGTLG